MLFILKALKISDVKLKDNLLTAFSTLFYFYKFPLPRNTIKKNGR